MHAQLVLLTGATGFIGQRLRSRLRDAGFELRCLTRHAEQARRQSPEWNWIQADLQGPDGPILKALEGCTVVYYLVHGMGTSEAGWAEREIRTAERFAKLSASAGVGRVIYLGGIRPQGRPSTHLEARLLTGEALRSGKVPCLELRASMVVGRGSASWQIVRDLAARLPVMVLPRWLEHRTEPVAVRDVMTALVGAATLPLPQSDWNDLPGPNALTGRQILSDIAALLGNRPLMIHVPLLGPNLSSQWIRLVTRANYRLARELVQGLRSDVLATRHDDWSRLGIVPLPFIEAARRAFEEERGTEPMGSRLLEAAVHTVCRKI